MSLLTVGSFILGFGGSLLIYRAGMRKGITLTFEFLAAQAKVQAEKDRQAKIAELYGKSQDGQS